MPPVYGGLKAYTTYKYCKITFPFIPHGLMDMIADSHPVMPCSIPCREDETISKIKDVLDKVNKSLSTIEQIRKFILIDHEFTIENNMMTPSMKVRRFKVKEMYGENLEKLY